MEHRVLLRKRVKVHGESFHVELREQLRDDGPGWFLLVNVYAGCEHDRELPYDTLEEALRAFEGACGVVVSDELKNFLKTR